MLGSFNQKSLELFQEAMSESMFSDFSEGEFYDFTTCIRPDGSAYGTGGKCRKGTEGKAKEKEAPKRSRGDVDHTPTAADKKSALDALRNEAAKRAAAGDDKGVDAAIKAYNIVKKAQTKEEAPKRSGVDLVTPQKQGQADVDRMKKYLKDESDKLKNLNDAQKQNPSRSNDPDVVSRKKVLERNIAAVEKQLRAQTKEAPEGESKDPVAGLRQQERSRQAKQAAEQKAKNLADAKEEMKSISDEIKNRGPHTKKELADLNEKMKYAANRARQIESGKTMTREQFQAGLRKMGAKEEEAPEVSSRRLSKTDRVTREVARTGGIIPGAAKPLTDQEKKSISERNKKSLEEKTKRKKEMEAKDAEVRGMAEKMANKQGTAADRPNKENIVNNFVGEINRLRYNSRDKNIQDMISRGDHEGITRLARARMSEQGRESKERIAQAVATERGKQRTDLKEALAKAPKEEHARIKELMAYGAKQEIARAKERAEQEENAMFSIGWNLKD